VTTYRIDRLRRTLDAIDGPAPAGRGGPACGLPHPEPDTAPVTEPATEPASIGLGRPADQAAPPPIACSLTGGDQAERVHRWAELLAGATSRRTVDHGLRFRLPAELAGEVAALAAAAPLLAEVFGRAACAVERRLPAPGVRDDLHATRQHARLPVG
jgi:MerR family transcriptional regulator, copper efflux regulator